MCEMDEYVEYYYRNPNNGMRGKYRLTIHQFAFVLDVIKDLNEWARYLSTLEPVEKWEDEHTKDYLEQEDP